VLLRRTDAAGLRRGVMGNVVRWWPHPNKAFIIE